ncbi:MAG: transposase [Chloroflexota bacterium]|nr:transposase [Chloroflexota bacterium]
MEVQRTITIVLPDDADLRATLTVFQQVQQQLSPICYNAGNPLSALDLQRRAYHDLKGTLNSQMTITAIRLVAGAYASAKRNRRPAQRPFRFGRKAALFLIGSRGRDADFRADGTLSIWTVAGRKRIGYTVPTHFQSVMQQAKELDSMTVIERNGRLIGRVAVTLEVPDPAAIHPVGVDRGETNVLVAVCADDDQQFVSGLAYKVKNRKTYKTRKRLQQKLASHKAEGKDTRSVRRALKRLGRSHRNRTRTFVQTAAKQLVQWVPTNSVIVLEDLRMPQVSTQMHWRKGTRRRMSQWAHGLLETWITNKAQERGIAVAYVNPAYTSRTCNRCGLRGERRKHAFGCPHCGWTDHADVNAALTTVQKI